MHQSVEATEALAHLDHGGFDLTRVGDVEFDDFAHVAEFRAVRRVSDVPRPAPESAMVAPSSRARRAMPKASESSVRTPVIRSR